MFSKKIVLKLLFLSLILTSLSFALLQWGKMNFQSDAMQIKLIMILFFLSCFCAYYFSVVLSISFFSNMVIPYYSRKMGGIQGAKLLPVWKVVLTKEKYSKLNNCLSDFK